MASVEGDYDVVVHVFAAATTAGAQESANLVRNHTWPNYGDVP